MLLKTQGAAEGGRQEKVQIKNLVQNTVKWPGDMPVQTAQLTVFPLGERKAETVFWLSAVRDRKCKGNGQSADADITGRVPGVQKSFCKAVHHFFRWECDGNVHAEVLRISISACAESGQPPVRPVKAEQRFSLET